MGRRYVMLNADELAELNQPPNGSGGFQTFIKRLQSQVNHATSEVRLTDDDVSDLQHYAFDFKQGGFQDRLIAIFGRTLGPKLGRDGWP
jgi:hypothetical protein